MEAIEAQMNQGKKKGLKLYDNIELIPVRDHLYMNYEKEFGRQLY
jgi:hypothetical protein